MTLCADPTLFHPSTRAQRAPVPSGVPMGIVVMPDFVVDVAIDGIRDQPAARRGQRQPMEVGGRAGRLVRVLQAFGGQGNAWYSLKYVSKAGDVGRVVLQRQFMRVAKPGVPSEQVSLRYVIPTSGGEDWLNVYGGGADRVESSHAGLDVALDDIDSSSYLLTDLFEDARYAVLASKDVDHVLGAVRIVAEALERLSARLSAPARPWRIPFGLLVDFSALASADRAAELLGAIESLKAKAAAFDVETTVLCSVAATPGLPDAVDHVLVRNDDDLRLRDARVCLAGNFRHPVVREAITAGYVLASAASLGWKLLRAWYDYCPSMRPISDEAHTSHPQEDRATHAAEAPPGFLPSLALNGPAPVDVAERLAFAVKFASGDGTRPPDYQHLSPPPRVMPPEAVEAAAAALVTERLVARFEGNDKTKSLYLPPSELPALSASCELRDQRRHADSSEAPTDLVVMFDLDATLLDSAGMLRACWFSGLRAFAAAENWNIGNRELHSVIDVYEAFIYKNFEMFKSLLADHPDIPPEWQPCDFRQVWNHRYAWAALLYVLGTQIQIPAQWRDEEWQLIVEAHRRNTSDTSPTRCRCAVCKRMVSMFEGVDKDVARRRGLVMPLRRNLTRFKRAIQAGRSAFWEVDYPAYPQARSCVQMVKAMPGCQTFIVTEGHEKTQLSKVKCAGLSDVFPPEHVLSTGAASAAEEARSDLLNLRDAPPPADGKQLERYLERRPATLDCISFLLSVLSALSSKKRFYCAAIEAVLLKPDAPASVLQSLPVRLRLIPGVRRRMKFVMVGDRYDNDCEPLLNLGLDDHGFVGVGTCRLLSGKRAHMLCPPPPEGPPTMLVCDTLAQVGHVLQQRALWKDIRELDVSVTPPVLLVEANDTILYGPVGASAAGAGTLMPLGPRLRDLAWAMVDEQLKEEPAVQDMVAQIQCDLAKCRPASLARTFENVRDSIDLICTDVKAMNRRDAEPSVAGRLLRGVLEVLAAVNYWRLLLARPLVEPTAERDATLEGRLGSEILRLCDVASAGWPDRTGRMIHLQQAEGRALEEFRVDELLSAIPYSHDGIGIVSGLRDSIPAYNALFSRWLFDANSMGAQ